MPNRHQLAALTLLTDAYEQIERLQKKDTPMATKDYEAQAADRQPSHYCVSCAATWLKHADGTWSVLSACGPCCDNDPMDEAPLIEFQPDGTIDSREHDRVKGEIARAEWQRQAAAYKGIKCAICDDPFEDHGRDWSCRKRMAPRFKFPEEAEPDARIAADAAIIERQREVALEIRTMCHKARTDGPIEMARALAETVNLAAQIATPGVEAPMTAEEALASAITGVLAGFEGPDHAASYAGKIDAELDKLGFAVVAKGDAK